MLLIFNEVKINTLLKVNQTVERKNITFRWKIKKAPTKL